MPIPKNINNLPKQISFLIRQNIYGDDLKEYKTDNELLIENTKKILKDYDLTFPDDEKESSIEPDENNFTPTVNSKLYLKPRNINPQKWYNTLHAVKKSLGLEGIPYRWIRNRGKLKIHRMAFVHIKRKKLEEKQAHSLFVKIQLSTLPPVPSYIPRKKSS